MKKRIISMLLVIVVAFALVPAANAIDQTTSPPEIRVFIDGRQIETDVAPYVVNGRTLIPISTVAQTLGATVDWDGAAKSVTIRRAWKEIVMIIDNEYATVNGEQVRLDVAPCITNGRTFLPIRFVAEQFSQKVEWDSAERIIYISEDMSFAYEDSNIRDWIIGCGAILARVNQGDPYLIGMNYRSTANAEAARRMLSTSWGCNDRGDLFTTIIAMTDYGHALDFEYDAYLANSLTDKEFATLLEVSGPTDRYMWQFVKDLSEKWGEKSIKAWDWFRMCHLIGWGYLAGYFELDEVYALVAPIAQRLLSTFSSWDEATENYMDGYAYWSRTDITQSNTQYTRRLQIYENLKMEQEANGVLFNPDVWTQPVIGVISGV